VPYWAISASALCRYGCISAMVRLDQPVMQAPR
jgi:hypothetical protein